jgi:hypothetical protein
MPLRINLYHEIHLQRKQDALDPLKISILVAIVACVIMALYYFAMLGVSAGKSNALSKAKSDFTAVEEPAKKAKERELALIAQKEEADFLVKNIEDRFYFAPFLEQFAGLVPPEIQIIKFSVDKPKDANGLFTMNIDGVAAGSQHPRKTAEEFRQTLLDKITELYKRPGAKFRKLEDGEKQIKVGENQLGTAVFNIDVEFSLVEKVEVVAPTPTPGGKRR